MMHKTRGGIIAGTLFVLPSLLIWHQAGGYRDCRIRGLERFGIIPVIAACGTTGLAYTLLRPIVLGLCPYLPVETDATHRA